MQDLKLDIVHAYTAVRKIKQPLLLEMDLKDFNTDNRSKSTTFRSRIISSAEVVRSAINASPAGNHMSQHVDKFETIQNGAEEFKSPVMKYKIPIDGRLRTPFKNVRPIIKKPPQNTDLGMTGHCASLFDRMKSMYPPRKKRHIDPRYSVRRVIKKSGLLKELGANTDLLNMTEEEKESSEVIEGGEQEVPKLNQSGVMTSEDFISGVIPTQSPPKFLSVDEPPSSIVRPPPLSQSLSFREEFERNIQDSNEERTNSNADESSFLQSPAANNTRTSSSISTPKESTSPGSSLIFSSQATSNYQYDTFVMKRTVEMELVQYLPLEDDWENHYLES